MEKNKKWNLRSQINKGLEIPRVYYIGKENTDFYGDCYYNRIVTDCPLDWQTIADDEMIKFLENDVVSQLMHIIDTPLHELGKETMIGEHCECDRQQCVACWIQKKS